MKSFNPARLLIIGYISIITIGAILLYLPVANVRPIKFIDSLFTSTSAVCVTGLVVRNTGLDFTKFGKGVILLLIQLGGLGYMTITNFLFVIVRRRLSMRQIALTQETIPYPFGKTEDFIRQIILFTFLFEAFGTILLSARFYKLGYPLQRAIAFGLFHSISAFCNAGFALFTNSFIEFNSDPFIILTISFLVIIGGLGFVVLTDIHRFLRGLIKRVTLHTKIVLIFTLILLLAGMFLILALEYNGLLKNYSFSRKLLLAFFQSVVPRTAGFTGVDITQMKPASLFLNMILMFIGASPGGTGGGIKTTTFFVITIAILHYLRGRKHVTAFGRMIVDGACRLAFIVFFLAITVITTGIFILAPGKTLKKNPLGGDDAARRV